MKGRKRLWFIYGALALLLATGVGFWARPVSYFNGMMYLRAFLRGVESRTLMVDGYHIHYNVVGPKDGPVVVLVHGLGGRAEDWRNLAPQLGQGRLSRLYAGFARVWAQRKASRLFLFGER